MGGVYAGHYGISMLMLLSIYHTVWV